MTLIIDAHEDIAWNMATFQRNYCLSVKQTRSYESKKFAPHVNGDTMLGWDAYIKGEISVIFATLFASPLRGKKSTWDTQSYQNEKEAETVYRNQLELYHRLINAHQDKFKLIGTKSDLMSVIETWKPEFQSPKVGLVILMEGAECIQDEDDLSDWWKNGVRIIGPAWRGNRFCGGTGEPGGLTKVGRNLLTKMANIGFILDISHMDTLAVEQSLDFFQGQIIASHANASQLIKSYKGNRHLPDSIILKLIQHNGVIGIIPFNNFLDQDWETKGGRTAVSLKLVIEQIDHICQLAGNCYHVGIGTDFDGGFGLQKTPYELNDISDLQKITSLLDQIGYKHQEIGSILGMNWHRMLEYNLP